MRVAAIDLGTNTVRLLVGEADGAGGYRPVYAAREITRLGQGMLPRLELQPEPIRRSLDALKRFCQAAAVHGTAQVAAVGTSALREARNRATFLAQARREIGIEVRVISGEEEARLTLLGVQAALRPPHGGLLLMDIGGGSTEFLLAEGSEIRATISTGLGAVKLTEAHLKNDPPDPAELAAVRDVVAARMARLRARDLPEVGWLAPRQTTTFVGTAGTVTTLAAIDLALDPYDPERVNGHRLSRDQVEGLTGELASLPLAKRRQIPGLEPGRADVIVAGALVCLGALDALGFADLTVSDGGLREGILLDLALRATARARTPDPPRGAGGGASRGPAARERA